MSASPHGTDGHGPETDLPQPVRVAEPPPRSRIRDRIGRRSRLIAVLLSTSLVYVIVDIFIKGPLTQLDIVLNDWDGEAAFPSLEQAARWYDKMGQRSVLVPILLLVAGIFARRHRTWRPVVLATVSFLVLNVVVGAMKILIGRSETETGSVDVLSGGVIFPSGHSSNMVLSGGLIIYLFWRYAADPPLRRLTVLIAALTLLTILTSLYIGSHWLTDLVGGVLVGGLLLQSVILFDRATADVRERPLTLFGRTLSVPHWVQPDRHRVDAEAVTGGGLRGVVEQVAEVRPAAPAPDLRTTHAE